MGLLVWPIVGRAADTEPPGEIAKPALIVMAIGMLWVSFLPSTAGRRLDLHPHPARAAADRGRAWGSASRRSTWARWAPWPGQEVGLASGVLNTARQLGAAIGVAILIATFGGVLHAHMSWFADDEIEDVVDDWEIPAPMAGEVIQSTLHDYTGGTTDRFEPKPGFDEEIIRQTAGSAREGFAWAFRQAALLILTVLPLLGALRRTPAQARAEFMAAAAGQGRRPASGTEGPARDGDGAGGAAPARRRAALRPDCRNGRWRRARRLGLPSGAGADSRSVPARAAASPPAPPAWPPTPAALLLGVEHQLGGERLLVGVRDPGERLDLAGAGALVEALHVAALALLDRRPHVDLDEALAHPGAGVVAGSPEGRHGRHERDHAVAGEQVRHQGDPVHVLVAVLAREAEAGAEVLAHVVAVEHLHAVAAVAQLAARRARPTVDLPEPDRPVSHTHSPCRARAGAASVPYAIGPRFGSRPWRSKARKR